LASDNLEEIIDNDAKNKLDKYGIRFEETLNEEVQG
jgi:hypothetical protein